MEESEPVAAEPIEIDIEEESEQEEGEEEPEEAEVPQLSPEVKGDMLFCVQNLGFQKVVDRNQIYVKKEGCLELLKELYKLLRSDNLDSHLRKVEIGKWNVIDSDLVNIIVSYPEDKQLAFYALVLLVTLTDKPERDHATDTDYTEILQTYKVSFITKPQVAETLVKQIVYCLTIDPALKNDRHDQMLELIIYLIRNVLAIPDKKPGLKKGLKGFIQVNSRDDHFCDLQRRFLHVLADSLTLEAIIYLAQDFKNANVQKLNFCLLEIFFHIFKHFQPEQLLQSAQQPLHMLLAQDQAEQRAKMAFASSRHSKFGSNYREERHFLKDSYIVITNPFQQLLDKSRAPSQIQQTRPHLHDTMKSLPDSNSLSMAMDSKLIAKMKKMCEDVLSQCYCSMVETVFAEFYRDSDRLEEEDKVHYFVFQAFCLEFARKKYCLERIEPFNFDVSCISESMKIENFEYLFKCFILEFSKTSKKEFNAKEFHAALRFCLQFLYCVKEMSESTHEEIKKNAQILLQNVFYYEISKVCHKAFSYWKEGISRISFLTEIVQFTHLTFKLLEEYSRGKVLTVQTGRLAHKSHHRDEEEELLSGDDSENIEEESIYKERQLNFAVEFSILVDPEILLKYCLLLRNYKNNSSFTNECIAKFLLRVVQDCQADWMLFQVDYLREFHCVLGVRENERLYPELYTTLRTISKRFFTLMHHNRLLPIEAFFRCKDKNTVNEILSNYEGVERTAPDPFPNEDVEDHHISLPGFNTSSGLSWSKEEDLVLLTNFYTFKDMDRVNEVLCDLLTDKRKNAQAVGQRLKILKVAKGPNVAREVLEELHYMDDIYSLTRTAPRAFKSLGKEACLSTLKGIYALYLEFRQEFPDGEFIWIPITSQDFQLMEKTEFMELLASVGFRMPHRGEWMVRLSSPVQELADVLGKLEAISLEEVQVEASEDEVEYSAKAIDSFFNASIQINQEPLAQEKPAQIDPCPIEEQPLNLSDSLIVTHPEPSDPPNESLTH